MKLLLKMVLTMFFWKDWLFPASKLPLLRFQWFQCFLSVAHVDHLQIGRLSLDVAFNLLNSNWFRVCDFLLALQRFDSCTIHLLESICYQNVICFSQICQLQIDKWQECSLRLFLKSHLIFLFGQFVQLAVRQWSLIGSWFLKYLAQMAQSQLRANTSY